LPKKALTGAYRSLQPTDKYTVDKLLFYNVKIKLKLISKKLVLSDQIVIMGYQIRENPDRLNTKGSHMNASIAYKNLTTIYDMMKKDDNQLTRDAVLALLALYNAAADQNPTVYQKIKNAGNSEHVWLIAE